jgi:hypothetical protein
VGRASRGVLVDDSGPCPVCHSVGNCRLEKARSQLEKADVPRSRFLPLKAGILR